MIYRIPIDLIIQDSGAPTFAKISLAYVLKALTNRDKRNFDMQMVKFYT